MIGDRLPCQTMMCLVNLAWMKWDGVDNAG
jgi:hypothetical protein